ncbi:hypothetical protein J3E69DRAFT_346257 [Trichoderma sp. SZMC 28015]
MTPLQLAMEQKKHDLIQVLIEYKAPAKGILAKEWRDVFEKQKEDIIMLSETPNGKLQLRFPEISAVIKGLSQSSTGLKNCLLVLNDTTLVKMPIALAQQQPAVNDLQIVERRYDNILDVSISLLLCLDESIIGQPSSLNDIRVNNISWRATLPRNPGSMSPSMIYFSTLPFGWIPDDAMDFFQQFMTHIEAQWSEVCSTFGESLSEIRLEQLKSKGKDTKIMDRLSRDAHRLVVLRGHLARQVSKAEKFMNDYCTRYNANEIPQSLRTFIKEDFGTGINKEIETLVLTLNDILQTEFALVSIHEARLSTKLAQNVMLLTYMSTFYLPLGFCAALWAIPNITDMSTRTPFILTATVVSLVTLLVTFNLDRIAGIMQRVYQLLRDYFANKYGHIASKWNEGKEKQHPSLV